MRKTIPLLLLLPLATTLTCGTKAPKVKHSKKPSALLTTLRKTNDPSPLGQSIRSVLDLNTEPCVDFYQFACGGWLKTTTLPSDQSAWTRSFDLIQQDNEKNLKSLLDELVKTPGDDPDRQRVSAAYSACLDEDAVEKQGLEPLKPWLAEIDAAKDPAAIGALVAHLHTIDAAPLFGAWVDADMKDPTINTLNVAQAGLGLPDRDYYLETDEGMVALRTEYRDHIARMLGLVGESADDAKRHADAIVALETELAKASTPRDQLRDPMKLYHPTDRAALSAMTPHFDYTSYFSAVGRSDVTGANVATPEFFTALDATLSHVDEDTMHAYLRWHLVHQTAPYLTKALVDENFGFFGVKLYGAKEKRARWKRCISFVDSAVGDALGHQYVDKYFAGDSKKVALEMIANVETAFQEGLPGLEWMDDTTRGRAVEKMHAIANKIGYPDKWRDYGTLELKAGDHFGNMVAAKRFETNRLFAKVGNPVDRTEWGMTPPTVNAYYNPGGNEIAFPAGILRPPMFDQSFPTAMNYGAMGMVMGHELTHGFDDEGRKYDGTGKLVEWWEPSVAERFEERAACVRDLYSSYEVQPGVTVNGQLTAGENIADLGGLKESFRAWKKVEEKTGAPPPVAGLSGDQLFFVAYAQAWCTVTTPEAEIVGIKTDPHAPPRFRVNGPMSQTPEFAEVFACPAGSPMTPEKVCEVW